ncbi:MAG: hypothetical protein K2N63_14620, partial [Lachnospiraceae bacterium]|nr:hypothetical protein [Lachnospiraceae bacterium]
MSDYRRWISYIYAYENGIKRRNAGYAKLELKDGKLTMTLHVTPDGREGSLRVCMYKCHSGSREGVLLGVVEKKQGGEGVRFVEDAANIGGSELLFQEMNGLLLYDEKGKYLISSWEDEPVDLGALQEIAAKLERTHESGETGSKTEEGMESVQEEGVAGTKGEGMGSVQEEGVAGTKGEGIENAQEEGVAGTKGEGMGSMGVEGGAGTKGEGMGLSGIDFYEPTRVLRRG